jgi:uncharacterized protein YdaU (DUF1376 family)
VNYFELHIGDYEAATVHLSMLEDAAYCRMIRIYYRTEKPLPPDVNLVCRLVRASNKLEREAVQQVLTDFFELQDDGWHQTRCDEELQQFREGEPEREAKKANEGTRLKRHREERAALFKVLTNSGQHAPWNTKIEELRRLAAPFQKPPATHPATAPATLATATHGNVSPDTNTQTPDTRVKEEDPPTPQAGVIPTIFDEPPQTPVAASAPPVRKRSKRTQALPMPPDFAVSPAVRAWAEGKGFGNLDEHLDAFKRKAKAKGYTYVDWDAAFMEAIREDWAKLRTGRNGAAVIPAADFWDGMR